MALSKQFTEKDKVVFQHMERDATALVVRHANQNCKVSHLLAATALRRWRVLGVVTQQTDKHSMSQRKHTLAKPVGWELPIPRTCTSCLRLSSENAQVHERRCAQGIDCSGSQVPIQGRLRQMSGAPRNTNSTLAI